MVWTNFFHVGAFTWFHQYILECFTCRLHFITYKATFIFCCYFFMNMYNNSGMEWKYLWKYGKKKQKNQINFLPYHRFIGFQKRWALSTEIDFLVLHYGNENTVGLLVNGVDLPLPMFILRLLWFLSEMEGVYILETSLGFL